MENRSTNRVRIAVIGTGRVAQTHLDSIAECGDRVELVAVCDSDRERATAVAAERGGADSFSSTDDLIERCDFDAAVIALPNHLHRDTTLQLAQAGKHILVEKPMAMNLGEAEAMVASAEKNGVSLMVGQSRRFFRGVELLRSKLPDIGRLVRMDVAFLVRFAELKTTWWNRADQAGSLVILLQGSHSLDTIYWLVKKLPDQVYTAANLFRPLFGTHDEANIVMIFGDGLLATVHLSLNTDPYHHELLAVGERGSLRLIEKPTERTYGFSTRLLFNNEVIFDEEELPSPYTRQLEEFLSAVEERRSPEASGGDVLNTMKLLDAAVSSITYRRTVNL